MSDAERDANELLRPVRDELVGLHRRQEGDRRAIADLGGGRLTLLRAAKAVDEAWNRFIEDDESMDLVVAAVGTLREAIEIAERTPGTCYE